MNKKAEMKFGETFGIIIIVYIVLVVGLMWYNNSTNKDIARLEEQSNEDRAFEKYYYIINSQFLHESQQGDVDKELNIVSLRVFSNYSKGDQRDFIRKKLGESVVDIEIYDKDFVSVENITLYDLQYVDPYEDRIKDQLKFTSLIPVFDPINDTTYFGLISVTVFE